MQFKKSLTDGYAKTVPKDPVRAKSLIKVADDALLAAKELQKLEHNYNSILRELYEALRQYCEALGFIQCYKFLSHEVITAFLNDVLNEPELAHKFDRYRQLRNGINYYGKNVARETVEKALDEIPAMIHTLQQKYLLNTLNK